MQSVLYATPAPNWNIAPSETPGEARTFSSISVQIRQDLPAGRLRTRRPPLPAVLAGYYSHHKVQSQLRARIQPASTCIMVTVQHTLPGPAAPFQEAPSPGRYGHRSHHCLSVRVEEHPSSPQIPRKWGKKVSFPPTTSMTNRALCSISQCCLGRDQYSEWRMLITGLQTAEPQSSLCY